MDLTSANAFAGRRNSFTSQQNIAHDIIADNYVTGDDPDAYATFSTDISLMKDVLTTTSATDLHMAACGSGGCDNALDQKHANNSSKRSYSVDTIKFQFPQIQSLQSSTGTTIATPTPTPSLATIANRKKEIRQRSQSAQYNPPHISMVKSPSCALSDSRQSFKSEENLREDLNEEEFIDSLIAEYTFSQDDYNNNNNSHSNLNNDDDDDDNENNFNDAYADEDEDEDDDDQNDDNGVHVAGGKNIELPEDDGDLTQVSSFDDDCYIFDAADSSMRKE